MKKALIIPLAALTIVGAASYLNAQVFATGGQGFGQGEMASRLASRFGLNQDEVSQFLEEDRVAAREEHRAQAQADFLNQLTTAVANGELTEEQKQLIISKHDELSSQEPAAMGQKDAWQDMTVEEREAARETRRADMDAKRAELEQWASDNGIDLEYFGDHQMNENRANGGQGGLGQRGR